MPSSAGACASSASGGDGKSTTWMAWTGGTRAGNRCGTPMSGSRVDLPYGSVAEARRVRTTSIQARKPFAYVRWSRSFAVVSRPSDEDDGNDCKVGSAHTQREEKAVPDARALSKVSQASPSSPLPSPLPFFASTSSLRSATVTSLFQPTQANCSRRQHRLWAKWWTTRVSQHNGLTPFKAQSLPTPPQPTSIPLNLPLGRIRNAQHRRPDV
ncbi:hypothetical protein MKEN_00316600 [Mycena kentingensis (nom. inval.)]|nr:hypothetical protein MKEN_00316600 [Mycena kentingensis (nom. inval.)]